MIILTFPICARCRKPVDEIQSTDNPRGRTVTFVAVCHGEREETVVPYSALMVADGVRLGEAFTAKTLPAAPKTLSQYGWNPIT